MPIAPQLESGKTDLDTMIMYNERTVGYRCRTEIVQANLQDSHICSEGSDF